MKKLLRIFIAVLALGATLTGCKKDDDNLVKNYFKVGDTEYELSSGNIYSLRETSVNGVFDVELDLLSKGIGFDSRNMFTGKGNLLSFMMYSSSLTDLPDGTYSYGDEGNMKKGSFWDADALINCDASTGNSQTDISIISGTLTIKKIGSAYEITISCTGSDGKAVTGYYKGSLTKLTDMS